MAVEPPAVLLEELMQEQMVDTVLVQAEDEHEGAGSLGSTVAR